MKSSNKNFNYEINISDNLINKLKEENNKLKEENNKFKKVISSIKTCISTVKSPTKEINICSEKNNNNKYSGCVDIPRSSFLALGKYMFEKGNIKK